MKIAGVRGGKTNRGDIIPLSPEKKVEAALKDAVVEWANTYKEGKYLCFLTNIKSTALSASPAGEPLKKRWDNNSYRASGTCTIHFRDKVKNLVRPTKEASFKIVCRDCLDNWGLPDLKIDSASFKI